MHTRGFDVGYDCEIGVLLNDCGSVSGSGRKDHREEKKDDNAGVDHIASTSTGTGSGNAIMSMASEYITSVMEETEILSPHFYYNNCNKNK